MSERRIALSKPRPFGLEDELIVPEVVVNLEHAMDAYLESSRFAELRAAVSYHLDRGGATLGSEQISTYVGLPMHYTIDGPFLLYLKNRGAVRPFFAVWVAGPEVLVGKKSPLRSFFGW
jgi:hypothetical protein